MKVRKHAPMKAQKKAVAQRCFSILPYREPANLCKTRQMKEIIKEIDEMETAYFLYGVFKLVVYSEAEVVAMRRMILEMRMTTRGN